MTPISFPNIHLSFQIDPVAITIGGISIYWYGILIASAIMLSAFLCKRIDGRFGISYDTVIDFSVFAIILGIVGARAYYVLFHWEEYSQNLKEIWQIHNRWACYIWRHCCSNYIWDLLL